jgi:hypothetical protein
MLCHFRTMCKVGPPNYSFIQSRNVFNRLCSKLWYEIVHTFKNCCGSVPICCTDWWIYLHCIRNILHLRTKELHKQYPIVLNISHASQKGSWNSSYLTFTGPCIVIYFYSKPTRRTSLSNLFIFIQHSTCFGQSFHPASKQTTVSVWHIPVAVCTVLNSWWWMERPSETCRVLNQNK